MALALFHFLAIDHVFISVWRIFSSSFGLINRNFSIGKSLQWLIKAVSIVWYYNKVLFLKNLIESWFDKRLPILSIVKFSFQLTVSVYSF